MKKLKIGTRLIALVAAMSLMTTLLGIVGLEGMARTKQRMRSVYEERTVVLVSLTGVLYDTLSIRRQLDVAAAADSPAAAAQALDAVERIEAHRESAWTRYRARTLAPEELALVEQIERDKRALAQARNAVIAAYRTEGKAKAAQLVQEAHLDERYAVFHGAMIRLIDLQARLAKEEYAAAQQEYLLLRYLGIATLSCCVLLGMGTAIFLVRSIAKPLGAAIRTADAVAAGDLSVQFPPSGRDQFGHLLLSLDRMRVNLRSMSEEIRARVIQLEEMSNALPLGVFQLHVHGDGGYGYNFVARRISAILGVSADEIMRDPSSCWRHVHPDDAAAGQAQFKALIRRALGGEAGASLELIMRVVLDGDTRLILATAYASALLADGMFHLSGYFQDVTDERRSQQLLQGVLDESPSIVFIKDLDGKHLLTNRAFERMFGLAHNGAIGATDFALLPAAVAERVRAVDAQVLAAGQAREFEEEIPVQGVTRMFSTIKFALLNESGQPYALCGISNDVTERRATELALRDSEAYNKVLFEESHVPIMVMEPDTLRFIGCNRAAASIHGLGSKEAVIGKTPLDVSAPDQYDGADARAALDRQLDAGMRDGAVEFEWRYRRPGGETWDAVVHQTRFHHGARTLMMVTVEDVTLRRRAEQAIRAAKEAAEEAARTKAVFIAIMSHEIRTPLNAILGNLELLAHAAVTAAEQERLDTVTASSRHLLEILNDILDYSKVGAGQLRLEQVQFDLVETVEQVLSMFAATARSKGLYLDYSVPPALPWRYLGDRPRIRQVLSNLVGNALKFTDSGGVSVELEMLPDEQRGNQVVVRVTDTGIGIDPSVQQNLFEPFMQADSSITRRFGGTGLGLALCRRLVDLMGGSLTVESVPGLGSRFSAMLRLPVAEPPAPARPEAASATIVLACAPPHWQAAILPHLQAWGFDTATPGQDAVPRGRTPCLLLLGEQGPWSGQAERLRSKDTQWLVVAAPEGPREPSVDGKRISVSCYSLAGLRAALRLTIGAVTPAPALSAEPTPAPGAVRGKRLRVLVAEDHPVNRALLRDQLATLGHDADVTKDGREALRQFSSAPYDLILTDLSMPELDGYGLARSVRKQDASVPIVVITAHTSPEVHQRCAEAGIDRVLTKPFNLAELDAAILAAAGSAERAAASAPNAEANSKAHTLPAKFHAAMKATTDKSLASVDSALSGADSVRALAELHSMRGAFLVAGMPALAKMCATMESLLREGDFATAAPIFVNLRQASTAAFGPPQ